MKILLDFTLALFLALPAMILTLIAAVFVRFETEGPAIFKQKRVGRHGRPFTMYKLRTMHTATGDRASHETPVSSITKSGHFLRRTKIDELPQIWSVLRGDMSFVGPRPCLPQQTELVNLRKTGGALNVKPGITGPAQLAGVDMSKPVKLAAIDSDYAKNHTFLTDLAIILRTATGKGTGDAVLPG